MGNISESLGDMEALGAHKKAAYWVVVAWICRGNGITFDVALQRVDGVLSG